MSSIQLNSSAFEPKGDIPTQYTCDGADISPDLKWSEPPPGTKSFVLIVDDPDAPNGTWVHWIMYNIPATTRSLPEHIPTDDKLAKGVTQGSNDFGNIGYGGPCPPSGKHRYFFKLYALDTTLTLAPGTTKADVETAMKGHILGRGELMGQYQKQK